ncbi:hypothetical protein V6Z12_D05G103500 [Gossypium hirsutum]
MRPFIASIFNCNFFTCLRSTVTAASTVTMRMGIYHDR